MDNTDIIIGALTAWRENRGGGRIGMQSVINVLVNRAKESNTSVFIEATKPWQFSSINAPSDACLGALCSWPHPRNQADWQAWQVALALATAASYDTLDDITGGATSYYATSITAPEWTKTMQRTATIAGQEFFKVVQNERA